MNRWNIQRPETDILLTGLQQFLSNSCSEFLWSCIFHISNKDWWGIQLTFQCPAWQINSLHCSHYKSNSQGMLNDLRQDTATQIVTQRLEDVSRRPGFAWPEKLRGLKAHELAPLLPCGQPESAPGIKMGHDMCELTCSNLATRATLTLKMKQNKNVISDDWQVRGEMDKYTPVWGFNGGLLLQNSCSSAAALFRIVLLIFCMLLAAGARDPLFYCLTAPMLPASSDSFGGSLNFLLMKSTNSELLLSANSLLLCLCGHDITLNAIR